MKCPFCEIDNSRVLESRNLSDGRAIRRRRECLTCGKRFTTYERVEKAPIMVIKKDKRREPFDSNKILKGLIRATEKRNIEIEVLEGAVLEIEENAETKTSKGEITSTDIGEIIILKLKEIDEVAYIRFASVYKNFKDVESFIKEIEGMKENDPR